MAVELRMLQMDQTMTKGKIGKWLVKEGDTVTQGQPLLEIETDKVVHEQESPADGVVAQLFAEEGTNVPVNALLAIIAAPGEEVERVEVDTTATQQASDAPQHHITTPTMRKRKRSLNGLRKLKHLLRHNSSLAKTRY